METLIVKGVTQGTIVDRVCRTLVNQIVRIVTLLEVEVTHGSLALLVDAYWIALLVDAHEWDGEQGTGWITLLRKTVTLNQVDDATLIEEVGNLRAVVRVDQTGLPAEIVGLHVGRRDAQLLTP